ncbi:HAMP domain-containing sensor histidine kinase [Catellatospora tritici]|uniref:HAMP domain-containing sensor histidine kinase n=1 Tax=Catellatospora tritici TaxID=2851566 RepID=UPI001C2CD741|nr:HAMP domain-containing sensor histidine kinase [Catellatospora tritici]MBV1851526.1 HAMP domain-containing histidine kinase [Catellatospora tritici]
MRPKRRLRPTLRLRLTLLNAVLLVGAGALLLLMAWLITADLLNPADSLPPGTTVTLADGQVMEAQQWQDSLLATAQTELFAKGAAAVAAISVVGVLGAYAVVGRALRPLHQVTATAQKLGGETMDQRINYAGADDEVAELADTFDEMLDRLGAAFTAQQRFVANASHELRTPLAVMRTEIDVTMSDPQVDTAELKRMANVVRDASERANALVDALLMLARSEGRTGLRAEPLDLGMGVRGALSAMDREVQRIKINVSTDLGPAPVIGDPSLLDRLAGNLIENAVRYNHLGGRIWVSSGIDGGYARLMVGNTGFEVDQADVAGLFEPFRRGGRERTGARGSGLGLSIVRAVCQAHGGTVGAVALKGGGMEVTIALPLASQQ